MRRLTTPTHDFTLPFDSSIVSKFLLTYVQNETIILEKTEKDMSVDGTVWSVTLKQEETKLFKSGAAFAQIRILTTDNKALASDIIRISVPGVFNEEVLK